MSVGQMPVGQMPVGKKVFDQKTWHRHLFKCNLLNLSMVTTQELDIRKNSTDNFSFKINRFNIRNTFAVSNKIECSSLV